MNKLEIINTIKKNKLAIAEVMDTIATEKRELSNVEKIKLDGWKDEIAELETRLSATPEPEVAKSETPKTEFNILSAIRNYVEGRSYDDATKRVMEMGRRSFEDAGLSPKGTFVLPFGTEKRLQSNYNATTSTEGAELVGIDKWEPLTALRANLVLAQAGARVIGGLKGDVSIPTIAATSVAWKDENAAATSGHGATSELTMSPFRLTAYVDLSKTLLAQSSYDVQNIIMNDLNAAVAAKLEESILSTFSGSTAQPAGLYATLASTTGATTAANIIALETSLETNNAARGTLAYLVHPNTKATLMQTATFSGSTVPILNNGQAYGYPVFSTTYMPAGDNSTRVVSFANWSDLIVGVWGNGYDILVDPYTRSIYNEVRLVVNFYVDWQLLRTVSLASKYLA